MSESMGFMWKATLFVGLSAYAYSFVCIFIPHHVIDPKSHKISPTGYVIVI